MNVLSSTIINGVKITLFTIVCQKIIVMLNDVKPNCDVTFLHCLQSHHASFFEHENVHAILVSVRVFEHMCAIFTYPMSLT